MKKTTTISKSVNINLYGIAETQARKIGALRFGNRNNCYEYLTSSSLSVLNEKSICFMLDKAYNGYNRFNFVSGLNSIDMEVTHFSVCCGIATLRMTATLKNYEAFCERDKRGNPIHIVNNFSTADIEIKYSIPHITAKNQEILPHKHLGTVKRFHYDDKNIWYGAFPYTLTIK